MPRGVHSWHRLCTASRASVRRKIASQLTLPFLAFFLLAGAWIRPSCAGEYDPLARAAPALALPAGDRHRSLGKAAALSWRGAPVVERHSRTLQRRAGESGGEREPQRASFDGSPDWVKAIVGGLTSVVNAIFGQGDGETAQRSRASSTVSAEQLLAGIREDFEERQYLWSGDIDPELYDENCVFTDPTLSFQGLTTFENNIKNLKPILDSVVPESQRRCILRRLQKDESGRFFAEWTMIGDLALPWKPRIELGGRTTYTPGADGRIVSYDESWDISAAEALGQILRPRAQENPDAAEHWPGRRAGASPPAPRVILDGAPRFVVLPGFGNDAVDYVAPLGQDKAVGLKECLARRGCTAVVSPVSRIDWLKVFIRGLMDEDFRAGNGTAPVAFGWYLDLAKESVEREVQSSGERVVVLGHSAGGWLARALMQREGKEWAAKHIRGLATLGAPHLPPPPGRPEMTQGCLPNLNKAHPGAYFKDILFYVTVAGDAVVGERRRGNLPIVELINSPSPESTAYNSYRAVCGEGTASGDGVVPLAAAHLDGARQLTLKGCLHSINIAGTTTPTDASYMCEQFVDDWLAVVADELGSSTKAAAAELQPEKAYA